MRTLTFTQKLLRQRSSLSSLIPLLVLFLCLGATQTAQAQISYTADDITVSASTTGVTTTTTIYDGRPSGSVPPKPFFNGDNLGGAGSKFNRTTGTLIITAASAIVSMATGGPITSSLQYRVFATNATTLPNFQPAVNLPQAPNDPVSNPNPSILGTRFANTAVGVNLLTQPEIIDGGDYTVEIRYSSTNGSETVSDPLIASGYRATFTVLALPVTPPGRTTTWLSTTVLSGGTGSTDWSLPSNWSNGVPNALSNAIIPEKGLTNPNLVFPVLSGTGTIYAVNNLTLEGTNAITKAELTIEDATLSVFGDLRQISGGLRGTKIGSVGVTNAAQNSTIIFAGANQVISGRLVVPDIIIAGSEIKSVLDILFPINTLSFRPTIVGDGVVMQTASENVGTTPPSITLDTSGNSLIDLMGSGIINLTSGSEETISSYVRGVLRRTGPLVTEITQKFGNIGLEMTPNHTSLTDIAVFRYIDNGLIGPTGTGAVPVRRRYEIANDVASTPAIPLSSDVVFHYLPSVTELNGIPEANLVMFRTVDNGVPYVPLGGVVNTTTHVVTRANLESLGRYTLLLGDKANPLPVRLTAFNAQRVGTNALITWQTASEVNSKGYDIQVSTNGTEYRTLISVPSASPNSTSVTNYRYEDKEANKTGLRYYRLRQVDLDGKEAFFAPKSVSFTGKISETTLVAYPNPFDGNDELHLAVQVASAGKGQLRITDMTGRTIREETVELTTGLSDLKVAGLNDLKSGVYLIRVTLPTGENKNLKVVKQ